jgi:hypothetical protein
MQFSAIAELRTLRNTPVNVGKNEQSRVGFGAF